MANLVRLGGTIAFVGAVLGLLYSPFHAAAYLATPDSSDDAGAVARSWSDTFREALPWAFDFASPQRVYEVYGLLAPVVLAALTLGVVALHQAQRDVLRPWGVWTFRIFVVVHAMMTVGAALAFWAGLLDFAFLALILPGQLLSLVGYVVYGVATLRAKTAPKVGAWLMVVGGLAQVPLSVVLGHNPIGFAIVFAAWLVLGRWLRRGAVRKHAPTGAASAPG